MKEKRLRAVASAILQYRIQSQEELLMLLKKTGIVTTQSTLSRDLKLLKVAKQSDGAGGYVYTMPEADAVQRGAEHEKDNAFTNVLCSVELSGNVAVLKTRVGFAAALASMIDKCNMPEIAGTVAGCDTVLAVRRTDATDRELIQALSDFEKECGRRFKYNVEQKQD